MEVVKVEVEEEGGEVLTLPQILGCGRCFAPNPATSGTSPQLPQKMFRKLDG